MPSDNDNLAATEIQFNSKDFGDDYSQQFLVFILGALGGGILVSIVAAIFIYFNVSAFSVSDSQLQSEYYRGIYDVCSAQVSPNDPNFVETCNRAIDEKFRAADWYSQASGGYQP